MDTLPQTWITGEEFARERKRLLRAGVREEDPDMRALLDRVAARDAYLFERYGRPLMDEHQGRWVAVSEAGDCLLGDDRWQVKSAAFDRFGAGNFALFHLGADLAVKWRTPDCRAVSCL